VVVTDIFIYYFLNSQDKNIAADAAGEISCWWCI